MRILVTGGAGFIGSHLVDALIESGHEVVVVDNLVKGKREYVNSKAHFFQEDILNLDEKKVAEIVGDEVDVVFHLAAQIDVRESMKNPVSDGKVNYLGSINLWNRLKDFEPKFVFVSSGGAIYGEGLKHSEKSEENSVSPYGLHKLFFEKFLLKFYADKSLIFRLANVYGPRQYRGGECGVVSIFYANARQGVESMIFGDGEQSRDFVCVFDVVDAFVKSIEYSGQEKIFNVGTGRAVTVNQVADLIPNKYKKVEAVVEEVRHSSLDNALLKREMAWEPRYALEEGIKLLNN